MRGKLSIITLAVSALARSVEFYRDGFGFPAHDYEEGKEIAFSSLKSTWLPLYPKEKFGKEKFGEDIPVEGSGPSHFILTHNVKTKKEVDEVVEPAVQAGVKLIKRTEEVFGDGYSRHFADPDGYLWEVAYNPFMDLS